MAVCCSGLGAIFEAFPLSKQVCSGAILAVDVFYAAKLRQTLSNATPDHFIFSLFLFPKLTNVRTDWFNKRTLPRSIEMQTYGESSIKA